MLYLREPGGKYPVGATTFVSPVDTPQAIGNAKLRTGDTLAPALTFEEIAFTVFYPARVEGKPKYGLDWISQPPHQSARGYASFARVSTFFTWPMSYLFGSLVKIPVYPNAPLLNPAPDTEQHEWPLVLFSHGLGGSRTTYSQICTRLAASGKVVIAMEHRDGSGPVVVNSSGIAKLYLQEDEPIYESKPTDPLPFRVDQLLMRRLEIYRTYVVFRDLVKGRRNTSLLTIDGSDIDWECWKGAVNCDENVSMVAHSFGGATLFSILSNPPPDDTYPPLPIKHAVALDPWLEPLASPGPVPYNPRSSAPKVDHEPAKVGHGGEEIFDRTRPLPQLLVINGEGFTLWKEHFERLETVVRNWPGGRLLTIVRARHHFFSDFNLIPVVKGRDPIAEPIMDVIAKLCVAFVEGKGGQCLAELNTRELNFESYEDKGQQKRRLIGEVADVIVH